MLTLLVSSALLLATNTTSVTQTNGTSKVEVHSSSDSNSTTSVTTSNTTKQKIEIDVNGEKRVYESDEPGGQSVRVESINGKTTVTQSKGVDIDLNITPMKKNPTPTVIAMPDVVKSRPQSSFASYVMDWVKDLFKNLFS